MDSILALFVDVDEFWVAFEPVWRRELLTSRTRQRLRAGELHPSELMTILILFHTSHYRTFKAYYTEHVHIHLRREFPHLVSYSRFVELMPSVLLPLTAYLWRHLGACTGLSFIDSTPLAVCHPARIGQHRVFAADARRGRTSVGWFYGFKLHVVVNDAGELLAFCLTQGNVDDRHPVPHLAKRLFGKLFGDKGYISQPLAERLFVEQGVRLITKLRRNMANRLLDAADRLLLRKRAIIEAIFDQLKNISQIEHTRHRSPRNFLVNLVCGLIAYCRQPKKPSLHLERHLRLETAA
ncbi:MAG TPA: IS982 family transposase [Ktedonobacterales bacterium]